MHPTLSDILIFNAPPLFSTNDQILYNYCNDRARIFAAAKILRQDFKIAKKSSPLTTLTDIGKSEKNEFAKLRDNFINLTTSHKKNDRNLSNTLHYLTKINNLLTNTNYSEMHSTQIPSKNPSISAPARNGDKLIRNYKKLTKSYILFSNNFLWNRKSNKEISPQKIDHIDKGIKVFGKNLSENFGLKWKLPETTFPDALRDCDISASPDASSSHSEVKDDAMQNSRTSEVTPSTGQSDSRPG